MKTFSGMQPGVSSLVPAPSHGEEGSGTMRIPNSFCWNAEVTCINLFVMRQSPHPVYAFVHVNRHGHQHRDFLPRLWR